MESPAEARTFSQVVFTDTPHSYPPGAAIYCGYALTFQQSPRDWVGIFKVGWSTTKDYHTFVWVEPCLDAVGREATTRQAVFKEYYLPKDELDFYQFCYVDAAGQVRGASTPFCFKKPAGQSPDSVLEEELLVITTQEQVELGQREKAELLRELDQTRGENETLKNERRQAAGLKEQNEQTAKEMSQLLKEMDQIKEQNENLRSAVQEKGKETDRLTEQNEEKGKAMSQLLKEMDQIKEQNESAVQETDRLKEEMIKQMEKRQRDAAEEQKQSASQDAACRQNEAHVQEKYDRAAVKINALQEEREQLRGRADAQSAEINTLNFKIREQERELFKMKDVIQLLQVDLQSLEKEKQRLFAELQISQSLVHDMVAVKRESQSLQTSLTGQTTPQSRPDDDLRAECRTLTGQLQDAQRKLAAEREETRNAKRRSEFLENELQQLRDQLEKVASVCEEAQRMSGKQELQLVDMRAAISEAREVLADKDATIEEKEQIVTLVTREKEALARENQTLVSDMERLRRALDDFQASPPAAPGLQPDDAADSWQPQPDPEEINPYENVGVIPGDTEEESLVCRVCQESFPGITQAELEQHEGSHRVCPYCPMLCDDMQQLVYEDHVYGHQL